MRTRKSKYSYFILILILLIILIAFIFAKPLQRDGFDEGRSDSKVMKSDSVATRRNLSLVFVKRIDTEPQSIFYSLTWYNDAIYCFYRKFYIGREIKVVRMNTNFEIMGHGDGEEELLVGSDPRCFLHGGRLYITDNKNENNKLIDYESKQYIPLKIDGKNLEYISYEGRLYMIHTMMPFVLYEVDIQTGYIEPVSVEYPGKKNNEYRGGTPGYPTNRPGVYYGFGHRTYKVGGTMTHDPFLWYVDMTGDRPSIRIMDIDKPRNAQPICDPTSVIEIGGKGFLITAESKKEWFSKQDYITNVYEIEGYENMMNVSVK